MDRLARNCMLARQAGMSYGKWKALQPREPIVKEEVIPKGWKKCKRCGKAFKPYQNAQLYCDVDCREQAYAENESARARKRYYARKRRERMKASEGND